MAPVEMGPRAPERQGQGLETVPEMARVPVRREPVQGLLELVPGLLEPVRGRREPVRAQDPAQVRAQDQVPDQEVDQDQAAAQARVVDLVQVQDPALVRAQDPELLPAADRPAEPEHPREVLALPPEVLQEDRQEVRAPAQARGQDQAAAQVPVPDQVQEVDQDREAVLVQVQVPDRAQAQVRDREVALVPDQVQEVDQDREAVQVQVQVPDRGQAQVRDREAGRVQDREVGRVQDREVALVPDQVQVQDRVPGRPRRPKHTTAHSAPPAEDVLLADLAARHAGSSRLSTVIYASSPDIIRPDWYPVAARLKARCPPWQARREVPQNFQALLRSSSRLFHRDRL